MGLASASRPQRALMAGAVVAVLYGLAAVLWFTGRAQAWKAAEKKYVRAKQKYAAECKLIARRAEWEERAEAANVKMPRAADGESVKTRWQRRVEQIAREHHVAGLDFQVRSDEQHGDVWELSIEMPYEAALGKLVEFLHALNVEEGVMIDVKEMDIKAKSGGSLAGRCVLTCAYMKETDDATPAQKTEGGKRK